MKTLLTTLYVILLGGSATVSGFAQPTNVSATEQSPRYFLHVFTGAMGSGTNMHQYVLILTTNILLGERFERLWEGGGPPLRGYVEHHDGKYFLHTSFWWTDTTDYTGEIELEKPFSPASHPMPNAILYSGYFVLSTNSDYKPFQEKLRADLRSAISRKQK